MLIDPRHPLPLTRSYYRQFSYQQETLFFLFFERAGFKKASNHSLLIVKNYQLKTLSGSPSRKDRDDHCNFLTYGSLDIVGGFDFFAAMSHMARETQVPAILLFSTAIVASNLVLKSRVVMDIRSSHIPVIRLLNHTVSTNKPIPAHATILTPLSKLRSGGIITSRKARKRRCGRYSWHFDITNVRHDLFIWQNQLSYFCNW